MRDTAGRLMLKVRVTAAATEGKANLAALSLIAKQLGRPRAQVSLVSGHTARLKRIEIEGVTEAEVLRAFGDLPLNLHVDGTKSFSAS